MYHSLVNLSYVNLIIRPAKEPRKMKVKVTQSCLTLQLHGLYSPCNSPGQNTWVGSGSLLQWIFPNPGIEHRYPALQADSLPAKPQGKTKRRAEEKCFFLPLKRDKNVWHLQAISSVWRPLAFLPVTLSRVPPELVVCLHGTHGHPRKGVRTLVSQHLSSQAYRKVRLEVQADGTPAAAAKSLQ